MDSQPLLINQLVDFLHTEFAANRYANDEQGGVYVASDQPIRRIGLALEPPIDCANWVRDQQLDALWLHRPWKLDLGTACPAKAGLPSTVGVLYNHLPFDETLTTGYNEQLARVVGMKSLEELGYKQSENELGMVLPKRAIGMIGNTGERTYEEWIGLISSEFGGYDRVEPGQQRTCHRVAVVGAMNAALIQEAHECGVSLYMTGEYRKGAQKAVDETGIAVIAIGHRRTEEWGLRALGTLLRERWRGLDVVMS